MKKQIINAIIALLLVLMPMAAFAAIGTMAGSGSVCPGNEIDIPVSVTNCNGVSAISLALSYDASKVTYLGYQNPSSHFGTNLHVNATGGVVYLTWYSLNAVDFGSEILIELRFEGINGTSALTWNTANCEYSDVNGNVITSSYTNGSVTVYTLPTVTSQPGNVTLIEGQNATFTVTATGSNIAYRWQVSTNGGTTWSDLSNSGVYSNVTTRQMRITGTPLSYNGNRYRCKVTGTCEPIAYSEAALLTVNEFLSTINTTVGTASTCPSTEFGIPVSVTNCNNVGAISLALSYNTSLVTYKGYDNVNPSLSSGLMEINEENGIIYFTWVAVNAPLNIGGANLFELLFESQSGNSNFTWNTSICEYSTPTGRLFPTSFTSGTATIYYVPSITSNPSNKTITEGSNTTFGISASGHGLSYRWQVSTDSGAHWSNLSNGTHYSNVTSATMNVLNATLGMDGYLYRCKVSGTCDPVAYSNSAVLHVNPLLPTIVTTLVNTTTCQDVDFDVDIAVTHFINVGSVSLALNYDTSKLTYLGYENLNSALEDGSIFVNERNGVIYVSWMSVDGATIDGGILMSLKFNGIAGNTTLTWNTSRCEYANVQGMIFPSSYQNGTVTVYAAPSISSQPSNRTIVEGSSTSISINASGRTLSYQWQSRPDEGSLWTDLANGGHYGNVTGSTLNINNATLEMNGRQYRCIVSGECEPEVVSNHAILTVRQLLPTIATGAGSLNTCSGTEFGIPVTVTNFIGVGAVSLALQYNPNILTYTGYEWVNSHLSNGDLHVNASDGVVYITWMSVAGSTIGDGTLLWIKFTGVAGNSTLTWQRASCEYSNTEGYLFPTTFSNGSVVVQQENFEITFHPVDQDVIMGDSTSFSIETEGQNLTFRWCVSEDGGASWTALESGDLYSDVNTETLLVNTTSFDMNGYLYRCEVNGSCGLKYSNPALLTVGLAEDFHQVVVTASPENGGEVSGEGVYYVGNSVTITATTNTGWHFVHWTENDTEVSTDSIYAFTIQEDHDFAAHFELNQYTISVSGNIGGVGELTGDGVYNYGETCTVSAVANEGFTFVCWTRDGNTVTAEPSFSFTVTENRTYMAVFTQNSYEIQAIALPEEGGTVEGGGQYVYGSTCTLTATVNSGFVFVNWTMGGIQVSSNPTFSFIVTESASYVAHFTEGGPNVGFHFITAGNWSKASNWRDGALPGANDAVFIDANCTLNVNANVAVLTVTTGKKLTLQSGKTLTVTGNLTNTSTTGLVIKDGAQLINATSNVAATMEKGIAAYPSSGPDGWYTIASPMDEMPIAESDFLTPNFDLYRFDETNLTHEEWQNYKANHPDFATFEKGRGYLYANSNSFAPAFMGTLCNTAATYHLTYTERPDALSGFNLIGNPFPHVIYKGAGGAIDNAQLASGYYTLTNEGAWHVHTYEDAIMPGQGILVKTMAGLDLTIAKSNATALSESCNAKASSSRVVLKVSGSWGEDRAFVYFGQGIGLDKMENLSRSVPSLWIRDNGHDYAIAHVDSDCESLELFFSNMQSGDFTLSVDVSDTSFSVLQLTDRITGVTIDLLQQPSYVFHSAGQENEARFSLTFKMKTMR